MAVFAPIPRAIEATGTTVKGGSRIKPRPHSGDPE
jgi:hypothetical protein